MKGKFTRKAVLCCWTIRLGLACLLLTGTALAGAGDLEGVTTEVTDADCATDVPTAAQEYTMGEDRTPAEDFIIRYTLNLGTFAERPDPPVVGGAGEATVTFRSGNPGSTQMEYDVDVGGAFVANDTTLTLPAPVVIFPLPSGDNTTMTLTVDLRDTGGVVDPSGEKTVDLVVLAFGGTLSDIAVDTELFMAAALRSEERVVAQLVDAGKAEIAELKAKDVDSMLADLFDALTAIVIVNDLLDSPEANQCLGEGVVSVTQADMSAASVLDTYVGLKLEDPSSEVTLQTLINLMGRAIEHKEDAMETLISIGFF